VRITEALRTIQNSPQDAPQYRAVLACSFTPLHLQTFFAAWLQRKLPERGVVVTTGLYGDLTGNLGAIRAAQHHAVAVPLEWSDLDPRLGLRSAGKWGHDAIPEILENARAALARLETEIERLCGSLPLAFSLPTTGLPPIFHTPGWQYSEAELLLKKELLDFAARLARNPGCGVVNLNRLAENSSHNSRYDLKTDLLTGLPYTLSHASALGEALATLLAPPPPKKGLITDLDDTLWHGLVGEVGAGEVSWDLASHQHAHGLYQKLLSALASEGILVAAASKNDPAVVRQALERTDLLLSPEDVFPVEVHWEPKSGSVGRILRTWNIAADSVVFVDDSPMELAEVTAAHPGIEPVLFPKNDPNQVYSMLRRLRDLFGKPRVSAEDSIRLESIRQATLNEETSSENGTEDFLRRADAVIRFDHETASHDPRALELVNKTNQFNLNGVRLTPADWVARLAKPEAFLTVVSYQDKFGPLGKIAVLQGRAEGEALRVETWVMSCRAFSRRIEHQCLRALFDRFGVERLVFDFQSTPKNGPLKEFLARITGAQPEGAVTLERAQFNEACPALYHRTERNVSSRSWTRLQTA
jgi:FkbH-like protein